MKSNLPQKLHSIILAIFLVVFSLAANCGIAADNPYQWFTSEAEARKAAQETGRPILVFMGRTGCHICEDTFENYLKGNSAEGKALLTINEVVGLKVADTLESGTWAKLLKKLPQCETNLDGSDTTYNSVYMFMFLENPDSTETGKIKYATDVKSMFGVYAKAGKENYTTKKVNTWVVAELKLHEDELNPTGPTIQSPNPLTFLEEDPSYLSTTVKDGEEVYDTANGLGKSDRKTMSLSTKEMYFKFTGDAGKRYVFSVTADSTAELQELVDAPVDLKTEIWTINADKTPDECILDTHDTGFKVLDRGFFFEPTKTDDYYLKLTLTGATTDTKLSFYLRWHNTEAGGSYDSTAGTLVQPYWDKIAKGKWSMDYDKALATEEPFLLYFTGLTWCPHCVSAEHFIFNTTAFKTATASMPLIILDNRRRADWNESNARGPSIMNCPSYQNYMVYCGESIANLYETMEAKLTQNLNIQQENLAVGSATISYPSLLICKGEPSKYDSQGRPTDYRLQVIARTETDFLRYYPANLETSQDFNVYTAAKMAQFLPLVDDNYEEDDNLASRSTAEFKLGKTAEPTGIAALIGGIDTTDWRVLNFSQTGDWSITIDNVSGAEYDEDAVITLADYDASGVKDYDGVMGETVSGTWSNPPVLEYRIDNPTTRRLKITINGQNVPVEYTVSCKSENFPPYDLDFKKDIYYVRLADGMLLVDGIGWTKREQTSSTGRAMITSGHAGATISDSSLVFGPEDESGELKRVVTLDAKKFSAKAVDPIEVPLQLTNESNVRVTGDGKATVKVFARPAFKDYNDGDVITFKFVQNQTVVPTTLWILNGNSDEIKYSIKGILPSGIDIRGVPGENEGEYSLTVYGTPNISVASSLVVISLTESDTSKAGATLYLDFSVQALETVNPTAANTRQYSGSVWNTDNEMVGTLLVNVSDELEVTANVKGWEGEYNFDKLGAWKVVADGSVYVEQQIEKSALLSLNVSPNGVGTGELNDGNVSFPISFSPVIDEATENYAGDYNVSLESFHPDFRGFGSLRFTIADDGKVTYNIILPDGEVCSEQTTMLAENDRDGSFPVFINSDASGKVAGKISVIARGNRLDEDTQPCVSACDTVSAMTWQCVDDGVWCKLVPCGAEYDASKTVSRLASFSSLNFYVVGEYTFIETPVEEYPDFVVYQFLPEGMELTASAGKFVVNSAKYTGNFIPNEELAFTSTYDSKGYWTGSFTVPDADCNLQTISFNGILVPVSASCCSAGPDALAYGCFFNSTKTKSWPVRIVPDASENMDGWASQATVSIDVNKVVASGAPKNAAYILQFKKSGTTKYADAEYAEDGTFMITDNVNTSGKYGVTYVKHGFICKNTQEAYSTSSSSKIFAFSTSDMNQWKYLGLSGNSVSDSASTKWEAFINGWSPMVYDANNKCFVYAVGADDFQPGTVFLVYVAKTGTITIPVIDVTSSCGGKLKLATYPESTKDFILRSVSSGTTLPEGLAVDQLWKWDEENYQDSIVTYGDGWYLMKEKGE